jgi:ABC-2 type transport system permease protein/lipopolysaccharide transport system permease protein
VTAEHVLEEPPDHLRYRRALQFRAAMRELWADRVVVRSLAERELKARYSQTVLGFLWALLAPITLMVVFTVFLQRVADIDTRGVAYPIFSYVGLIPWTFFQGAVSTGGLSLISNTALLNKVYAPREVFPLASIATRTVDSACATLALFVLFAIYTEAPAVTSYWAIPLLAIMFAFTTAVTLFVSAATVYLRDLRHALPLLLQLGLFVSPIAYSVDNVPEKWRELYVALNPIAAVIDGLRRSVLYGEAPHAMYTSVAAAASLVLLAGAYLAFKQMETGFADVA